MGSCFMTTNMSQLFLLIFLVPVVRGFGVCETLDQLIRLKPHKDFKSSMPFLWNYCKKEESSSGPDWCYEAKLCGQYTWPTLDASCAGLQQSPVNIPHKVVRGVTGTEATSSSSLAFTDYNKIVYGVLENKEYTATLSLSGASISGGPLENTFQVEKLLFHWGHNDKLGSEHLLQGRSFPLEMQILHSNGDDRAVIGIFFETGNSINGDIQPLIDNLPSIRSNGASVSMEDEDFKLSSLLSSIAPIESTTTSPYASYTGSLTSPPCSEGVQWINLLSPIKISYGQMEAFRSLLKEDGTNIRYNYRNVQPLNHRRVSKSDLTQGLSQDLETKIVDLGDDLGSNLDDLDQILHDAINETRGLLMAYIQSQTPETLLNSNWDDLNSQTTLRYFSPDTYTYSNDSEELWDMGEDIGCTVGDDDVTLSLPQHFRADLPIKIATH